MSAAGEGIFGTGPSFPLVVFIIYAAIRIVIRIASASMHGRRATEQDG